MTIDVEKAFRANPRSVLQFLQVPGQGCYIPAYQREYRWDRENVNRLFEDALHGLSLLPERAETISFLGTIIAIHDTQYVTVKPHFRNEMPRPVMTIIDGQQRISTFVLLFVATHNLLATCLPSIEKDDNDGSAWLLEEIQKMMAELRDCFILDKRSGKDLNRYYPRLIRSFDDVWSSKPEARYSSAIARLIWEYLKHIETPETIAKLFRPPEAEGKKASTHKNVAVVFRHMNKRLRELVEPSEEMPNLIEQALKPGFGEALFGFEIPPDVAARLRKDDETTTGKRFRSAFAAIIFAHYLQRRMAFTVVESEGEDDAFDMFEALNTTGEPLTAFETFRPRVIDAEGLEDYQDTPSHDDMARTERYVDRYAKDANKLQRTTSELLVAFALAETGQKLGKKLNEQRRYLRQQYGDPDDKSRTAFRRGFVKRLGDVSDLMSTSWDPADTLAPNFAELPNIDESARVAFEFLRSLKHTVTIPPLSRFFGAALSAEEAERELKSTAFSDAIKASAAFTAIWRGAFGTTSNIDAVYRDAMLSGDGQSALAARPASDKTSALNLDIYKRVLKNALERAKISEPDAWVAKVETSLLAKHATEIAKFLLIGSAHDAEPDGRHTGLVITGRKGVHPTLTLEAWRLFSAMQVEHVAPQQGASTDWSSDLYDERELFQTLGNLTLLHRDHNIVVSNHPWPKKMASYRALASRTPEEFEQARNDASSLGFDLPERSEAILAESTHARLLVPITQMQGDWDGEFVRKRSRRLAELAWERLRPWLD